jgi:methylamine dehydrogenase accessory protein MauD
MEQALIAAVVVLSLLVFGLVVAVFALSRQVGIIYERIAPMGALIMDAGPAVGDAAPGFTLASLDGRDITVGGAAAKASLLFFLSPTCPVCKKLLPVLKSTARSEQDWLNIVLASDGERAAHEKFYRQSKLDVFPYLLSTELGMAFKVSRLPYAVLLDEAGRVRAKGLVNSREQLESLFTARELGVSSVQDYLQSAS